MSPVNVTDKPKRILYTDFSKGHDILPISNPMSTLNMALLSRMLTVAHMEIVLEQL